GVVAGYIALAAMHMRERIDAESSVVKEDRAPEEADDQAGPAADGKTQRSKQNRRHELVSVQPHQFRIAREISDLDEIGRIIPARENPADMAIEKTPLAGRMDVALGIRVQMMLAMLGRPPQHAFLCRALR